MIESIALKRKDKSDTLSEQVWKVFHTKQGQVKTRTTQARRAVLVMFLA